MTTIKLISFDQSTKNTGYSCFVDGKWQWSRTIDLHKITDKEVRTSKMIQSIYEILESEKPDIVAFEQVANQSNVKTVVTLAQLQGAIIGKCVEMNIPYKIIEPSHWRRICGIAQGKKKREELKQESLKLAHELFDENLGEDAAESALLGYSYLIEQDWD